MHVKVEGLAKSYWLGGQEIPVLKDVRLELRTGELVSVTGPSGVGKSTLLHVIGTLDQPSRGRVLFDDVDVFSLSPAGIADFRNRNVGFVFQFHHLLPEFTALENVMMPALIARADRGRIARRAEDILADVGLSHRLHHRPGELSGGEQQRVALARALVNEPKVLLADEPTGNLDEATGEGIHDLLARWNRERAITVVVVTHNPRLALRMPRRVRLTKEGISDEGGAEPSPVTPPSTPAAPGM